MKASSTFLKLAYSLCCMFLSVSVIAQFTGTHEQINKITGKKEYYCTIPLHDSYTLCQFIITKVDSNYFGELSLFRSTSKKFTITDDCPLVLILESGQKVEFNNLSAEKMKTTFGDVFWGGIIATSDKEFQMRLEVTKDALAAISESPFIEGRQYFHSENNGLNGAEQDERGTYFKLNKTKEKDKKMYPENIRLLMAK